MERSKIALFVDVENLTQWIKRGGPETLISELASTGQLIVRRAYGNWGNTSIQHFQGDLNRLGFELIHNFHPISKKNSSDIQLTIDVMDHALRLQDVQWFVLATGDSDFSPLFRRLREMGKDVIGVGPRSPLSESVKTSCSKFIYTNLHDAGDTDNAKAIRSAIDDAMDMLESILKSNQGPQPLAAVKSQILNIDSAFSEKALGFSSFMEFIKSNEHIHVAQEGKNAAWTCQLKLSETRETDSAAAMPHEPLEKQYERLLRRKQWRPVSATALKATHQKLTQLERPTKQNLIQAILDEPGSTITQTDINKALIILMKAGLTRTQADESGSGEKLLSLVKHTDSYLLDVDIALLSRLLSSGQEQNVTLDKDALRDFLYGKYDNSTFEDLIQRARARATDSLGTAPPEL